MDYKGIRGYFFWGGGEGVGERNHCNLDCGSGFMSVCVFAKTYQIPYFKYGWALEHTSYLNKTSVKSDLFFMGDLS